MNMNEDQNNASSQGELPDAGNLCDNAVEFIYGAANIGIKIIGEAESGQIGRAKADGILTRILTDIKMEITDCPEGGLSPEVYCHTCLPTYNACISHGGLPATCLSQYETCVRTCTPG